MKRVFLAKGAKAYEPRDGNAMQPSFLFENVNLARVEGHRHDAANGRLTNSVLPIPLLGVA